MFYFQTNTSINSNQVFLKNIYLALMYLKEFNKLLNIDFKLIY